MSTSRRERYEEAEDRLLRYVQEHGPVKATVAVNAVSMQRYSLTLSIVRGALWHLVYMEQLHYDWDGIVRIRDDYKIRVNA